MTSTYQTTTEERKSWVEGSAVEVFIRSRHHWYASVVKSIYNDTGGEWLLITIQDKVMFEFKRYDPYLRRPKTPEEIEYELETKKRIEREKHLAEEKRKQKKEEKRLKELQLRRIEFRRRKMTETSIPDTNEIIASNNISDTISVHSATSNYSIASSSTSKIPPELRSFDSGSDLSTDYYTESENASSSALSSDDSFLSLDSIDSDILDTSNAIHKKDLYADEMNEDPALIIILVDRGGSNQINGKYIYKGLQRTHGLWQKDDDEHCKIWWKYENLWVIEHCNHDLYICYSFVLYSMC